MDDDFDDEDHDSPEVAAARAEVGRAIAAYMNVARAAEQPFVVAWAVGVEWTSTELEQSRRFGRSVIVGDDQPGTAAVGLAQVIVDAFG